MNAGTRPPGSAGSADPPIRLLWGVGVAAVVLAIVAFALWIRDGAGILFDMMLAFCL